MFETMASFMLVEHANGAMFDPPLGPAMYHRTVAPNRKPYRTKDGYISALIYNDRHWASFINAVQPAWNTERYATLTARAAEIDTVYSLVAQTMTERTTEEWLALFVELEIPAAPLNSPQALFDNEQLNAVGFFETVPTPRKVRFGCRACRLGSPAPPRAASPAQPPPNWRRHRGGAGGVGFGGGGKRMSLNFDMGGPATELRSRLRELVHEHVPEDFLGAFTDDPRGFGGRATVLPNPGRTGVALPGVAGGVRRSRRLGMGADGSPRGDVGAPRTTRRPVHGGSTGWGPSSCGTAPKPSSASISRRSPAVK